MALLVDLWTYQGPGFSLTSGRVDHRKSAYFGTVHGYLGRIETLAKMVKTDQIVWCFADPGHKWFKTSIKYIRYTLKIPEDKLLKSIDSWAWETILGQKTIPPSLEHKYMKPWEVLFRDRWTDPATTVLVQHPLDPSWIIDCQPWQSRK